MKPIALAVAAEYAAGILQPGAPELEICGVCTDSRKAKAGDLFVALKGERFDGHDFIPDVYQKGVRCFLVEKELDQSQFPGCGVIRVGDTLTGLQQLAKNYRKQFDIPVIAVTGSVGKTTTKDLIAKVLEQKYKVLSTYGNTNNHIGLPLNIFGMDDTTEIAVLEMGMSHLGEISLLSQIAQPTCGVITNIGMSHIGNLGSQDNILKAKLEILDGMKEPKKLYLNGDDPFLWSVQNRKICETAYFGVENPAAQAIGYTISSDNRSCRFQCDLYEKGVSYFLNIPGEHNVYNALAALMIAKDFGLEEKEAICGLLDFVPFKMRMNVIEKGGVTLILDCYNASPSSMNAAIGVLKKTPAKHSIAILGEMAELGSYSAGAHRGVGKMVAFSGIDYLITLGDAARWIETGARAEGMDEKKLYHFDTKEELMQFTDTFVKPGDAVLIKASRSIGLEDVGLHIEERIG